MKFLRRLILGTGLAALLAQPVIGRADEDTTATPDFKEVYDAIRTHLAGESEADLNRAAVQGLLDQLHAKVSLTTGKTPDSAAAEPTPVLAKSLVYNGEIAYLRVGKVAAGVADKISAACKDLAGTNGLKGIVLDLRFADGTDYAAAAAAADLFIAKERPLLDWGNGVVQSKAKGDALTLPLAILINRQTAAAAEALAAILRQDDRAILIGATTAGEATMSQEFPLKDGKYLRIATAGVKLGDGETLSAKGVKPDIQVSVKSDDERAYFADPYKQLSSSLNVIASIVGENTANSPVSTNSAARAHQINEAELMKMRKEKPGVDIDELTMPDTSEPDTEKPVVRDPVLGRALDLMNGIAVIRKAQSL